MFRGALTVTTILPQTFLSCYDIVIIIKIIFLLHFWTKKKNKKEQLAPEELVKSCCGAETPHLSWIRLTGWWSSPTSRWWTLGRRVLASLLSSSTGWWCFCLEALGPNCDWLMFVVMSRSGDTDSVLCLYQLNAVTSVSLSTRLSHVLSFGELGGGGGQAECSMHWCSCRVYAERAPHEDVNVFDVLLMLVALVTVRGLQCETKLPALLSPTPRWTDATTCGF